MVSEYYRYQNKIENLQQCKDGIQIEEEVSSILQQLGEVTKSTQKENRIQHIDYWINHKLPVDVKNFKHIYTKSFEPLSKEDKENVVIEIINDYGYDGWLYAFRDNKEHCMMFRMTDTKYLLVNTKELYDVILKKIGNNNSTKNTREPFTLWNRDGALLLTIPMMFIIENVKKKKVLCKKEVD